MRSVRLPDRSGPVWPMSGNATTQELCILKQAFSLRTHCVPVPLSVLVSIGPADSPPLDSAVSAGTVYSASKRQHSVGFCPE